MCLLTLYNFTFKQVHFEIDVIPDILQLHMFTITVFNESMAVLCNAYILLLLDFVSTTSGRTDKKHCKL